MPDASVDQLRQQLKELGYLTHGIERWFALDPWSSRAFWTELLLVALKAATLLSAFAAAPAIAVMLLRNRPMPLVDALLLSSLYLVAGALIVFLLVVGVALALKVRPSLPIDSPASLTAVAVLASIVIGGIFGAWWIGFERPPETAELITGLALVLLFFVAGTYVFSAAFLSFSIYETRRVPSIHQKSRAIPVAIVGTILLVALLVPVYAARTPHDVAAPEQIVVAPSNARVVFVAVDGLTWELFSARPRLRELLPRAASVKRLESHSSPERWATVGTGTLPEKHGVHAIEGVRLRGSERLIQSVSRFDVVMRRGAEVLALAQREPLPPSIRRRAYVWETIASRGIRSASVNWWTTEESSSPALTSIAQEAIFARATRGRSPVEAAAAIDRAAIAETTALAAQPGVRFATVYLPALDIFLNRLRLDPATELGTLVRSTEEIEKAVERFESAGFEVILVGMPSEDQAGGAVVATNGALDMTRAQLVDVAPTICDLFGFPRSAEMPGRSFVRGSAQAVIPTFGERRTNRGAIRVDEEYYKGLRSLGYIQ